MGDPRGPRRRLFTCRNCGPQHVPLPTILIAGNPDDGMFALVPCPSCPVIYRRNWTLKTMGRLWQEGAGRVDPPITAEQVGAASDILADDHRVAAAMQNVIDWYVEGSR